MENNCIQEKISNQKCLLEKRFSELSSLEKCELIVEILNKSWLKFTIKTIQKSLLILFILGIVAGFLEKPFDVLENLNTWVGFILGIIATFFSIISMFLSFYNLEKAKESEDEIKKTLGEIKEIIRKTENNLNSNLEKISSEIKTGNKELLNSVKNSSLYSNISSKNDSEITQY